MAARARGGVQQQRHVREQALRQHVAGVRGVDLAVDGERRGAGRLADRHRGRGAFLVVEQVAGGERDLQSHRPYIDEAYL